MKNKKYMDEDSPSPKEDLREEYMAALSDEINPKKDVVMEVAKKVGK